MTTPIILSFEKMLAAGKEDAMLRFALGGEYLKEGDPASAAIHLRQALRLDPQYSAAWKLLGRALAASDRPAEALAALREGIEVAEARGDKQAAREMGVLVRRIERNAGAGEDR